jgi:type II secretory pathway component PulF
MKPALAFAYRGARAGRRVSGMLYAANWAQARSRLRRLGVSGNRLRLAPWASVMSLARPASDPLDLEGFYTYLARVHEKGLSRAQLLGDAIEFVQDERLRFAISAVRDAVQEGVTLGKAMLNAGFPGRDCQLIIAGEESGRVPQVLAALAREVRREADLRRALKRLQLSPAAVAIAAYVLGYLAIVVLAPPMARKFAVNAQAVSMPEYARLYYGFVEMFNRDLVPWTLLYLAAGVAIMVLLRTAAVRAVIERLFPSLQKIAELSEMAQLWGAFSMMADSGAGKYQIAQMLARAAERPATLERFRRLERQFRLGVEIERAVERAAFPRYVISGVRAAAATGQLPEGTRDLAERLTVQAAILTAHAQTIASGFAALLGALLVLAFAAVTILPQMSSVLGSF